MTRALDSLTEVAGDFDAIVLDQWGVLHDGTAPYPGAIKAVEQIKATGVRVAVLSNSGKRADLNRDRICAKGYAAEMFDVVMTSGEALWQDMRRDATDLALFAITAAPGDADRWADGLSVTLADDPAQADAILLMGLPDEADIRPYQDILARADGRPIYCTNPDRASPRADGVTVTAPGSLAHAHADQGGQVIFYGKPHPAIFRATERALNLSAERLLMVGDSLEHDIAGGHGAGWSTLFVEGGLHAAHFANGDRHAALAKLVAAENAAPPDFTIRTLA